MTNYILDPDIDPEYFHLGLMCSNDPIRKVAALLVFPDTQYTGFNFIRDLNAVRDGQPNPISKYIWTTNRALGRLLANHAEHTAILEAVLDGKEDFNESILYVSLAPCDHCRKIIEAAGIPTVVFVEYYVPTC